MKTEEFEQDLEYGGLLWKDVHERGRWYDEDLPDLHAPGPPQHALVRPSPTRHHIR